MVEGLKVELPKMDGGNIRAQEKRGKGGGLSVSMAAGRRGVGGFKAIGWRESRRKSEMGDLEKSCRRRRVLHVYRVAVFVFLLVMVQRQHAWYVEQKRGALKQPVGVEEVRGYYAGASELSDWDPAHGGQNVLDAEGKVLGHVIQTSPEANRIVGFSGPTNTLIALSPERRVLGISVLRSDDTKEHVGDVLKDDGFLGTWDGLPWDEAAALREVDGVSGATLTSMAIADGIAVRLGGGGARSRFPDEIGIGEVRAFLPGAESMEGVEGRPYLFRVLGGGGEGLGFAARTSPHGDHMMGYQGPTDLLVVLDAEERVSGLAVRGTFDNAPYVKLMVEDEYFLNLFTGFGLGEIAQLDPVDAGIDGVTGATKTSVTVAEALIYAAGEIMKVRKPVPPRPLVDLSRRDVGTALVVLLGCVIAFTRLRGSRRLRIAFQVVLVGYLGFVNADMVSQALLVGWAQNGVAWRVAPGLVLLTAAALVAPVFTGRQVYCTHLCPYGAAQDWLRRRGPFQVAVSRRWERWLKCLPVALLVWVMVVALGHLPFSLVGIEPFDAFVFRIAGWMTITVALLGLVASLFINRAYCRYGCPTGAMLGYLRAGSGGGRMGRRDVVAAGLALLAVGMVAMR